MQIRAGQKIAEIFLASEMTFPLQIALHCPDMRDLTNIRLWPNTRLVGIYTACPLDLGLLSEDAFTNPPSHNLGPLGDAANPIIFNLNTDI
jgi:hypothetical protein